MNTLRNIALVSWALGVAYPCIQTHAGPAPGVGDWSGFYVGGNAGGLWGKQTGDFVTGAAPPAAGFPASPAGPKHPLRGVSSGPAAGLDIGYNWQTGPLILGAELDLNAISYDANVAISPRTPDWRFGGIHPEYAYFKQRANGLAELRGRAGYATGAFLAYVSGGVALTSTTVKSYFPGDDEISTSFPNGFPTSAASVSSILVGYALGGGFDYKFSERWTLGLEYQHIGFGNGSYQLGQRAVAGRSTGFLGSPPTVSFNYAPVSASSGWQADMVTLKLSYLLGAK